MKDPTNKELLDLILIQTQESAKKQFEFSCEMSIFANEQRDFNNNQILLNSQIKGYFESNDKTKQKGLIEQQQLNVRDINTLKNQYKIVMGVSMVLGFLSGYFSNLFNK
jgi:hypothetical protein